MERTKETVSQEKVVGVSNHRRELRSVKFVVRFGYMKHIISALLAASLVRRSWPSLN
jgi:hypothetical protein